MGWLSSMLDPRKATEKIQSFILPQPGKLPGQRVQGYGGASAPKATGRPTDTAATGLPYYLGLGEKNTPYPGVDALYRLLGNPGQTDSLMLNRNLLANMRGTQGQQTAAQGRLAASGFGNSGLGEALQASIGQAGLNRQSDIYAQEGQRREDLLRGDLGMLLDFFVNPELTTFGANKGVSVAQSAQKQADKGAKIAAGAGLLASLIGAFACATAEELYGADSEDTAYARLYMGTMAEPETRAAYGTGRELAERVRRDPALRAKVRPIFDGFVREAKAAFGGR